LPWYKVPCRIQLGKGALPAFDVMIGNEA
jgi:hypothetical protein